MANPKAMDPATVVAVAPTPTTLATFDTSATQSLTVQVTNQDAAQTLDCTVSRQAVSGMAFAATPLTDLVGIAPLSSAAVDVACEGNLSVRIIGTASGAGLNCLIAARDKPRRP